MTNDDVNWTRALDELRNAPAKASPNVPLKTKIAASIDEILAFRSKGYSDDDILEILKRNGVVTTIGTLRHYIGIAKRAQKGAASQRRMKSSRSSDAKDTRIAAEAAASTQSSSDGNDDEKPIESGSRRHASAISSEASKPLRQRGKTASEVLGHRLDDSEL